MKYKDNSTKIESKPTSYLTRLKDLYTTTMVGLDQVNHRIDQGLNILVDKLFKGLTLDHHLVPVHVRIPGYSSTPTEKGSNIIYAKRSKNGGKSHLKKKSKNGKAAAKKRAAELRDGVKKKIRTAREGGGLVPQELAAKARNLGLGRYI